MVYEIFFCSKFDSILDFQGFKRANTSVRYTKKHAPKINSDLGFTKNLRIIAKIYFIY